MSRRKIFGVAVAAVVVLAAGIWSLARHHAGYPLNPIDILARDTTAEGRRELRALRKDPVLDFRAPKTRLRRSTEVAAGRDWKNASQPTEIRRLFTLQGEPGTAVETFHRRAEAAGWKLHGVRCSFALRSTSVRLTRVVAERVVTLHLYGYFDGLLVSIKGEEPPWPADGPEGARLRRRDVHCLRAFDPSSPDLHPPARQPDRPEAVCDLLPVTEARRIVPTVTTAKPWSNAGIGCRYEAGAVGGFSVVAADRPKAFYQDRQSPLDPGDRRFVLLDEDTSGPPNGVWVDTRVGPVEVYAGGTLDARQLTGLAELLGRR